MFPDLLETIIVTSITSLRKLFNWFKIPNCRGYSPLFLDRLQSSAVRETFRFLNQNPYRCMPVFGPLCTSNGYQWLYWICTPEGIHRIHTTAQG